MDMSLSKLKNIVKDREACSPWGHRESDTTERLTLSLSFFQMGKKFKKKREYIIIQLSHPYVTTGKMIALTRWTFVGKVMSLLFNMLSRYVFFMYFVLCYSSNKTFRYCFIL